MASIFTKIVKGEIRCHKLYEDEKHLAFLDVRPIKKGHSLVIPKKEVDYIFDLEDDELAELIKVAKKVAKGIEAVIPCKRIGLTVIGLEVPHTHIHLLPIHGISDIDFSKAKNAKSDTLAALAEQISNQI